MLAEDLGEIFPTPQVTIITHYTVVIPDKWIRERIGIY